MITEFVLPKDLRQALDDFVCCVINDQVGGSACYNMWHPLNIAAEYLNIDLHDVYAEFGGTLDDD